MDQISQKRWICGSKSIVRLVDPGVCAPNRLGEANHSGNALPGQAQIGTLSRQAAPPCTSPAQNCRVLRLLCPFQAPTIRRPIRIYPPAPLFLTKRCEIFPFGTMKVRKTGPALRHGSSEGHPRLMDIFPSQRAQDEFFAKTRKKMLQWGRGESIRRSVLRTYSSIG